VRVQHVLETIEMLPRKARVAVRGENGSHELILRVGHSVSGNVLEELLEEVDGFKVAVSGLSVSGE
jgi:hypothetical protein